MLRIIDQAADEECPLRTQHIQPNGIAGVQVMGLSKFLLKQNAPAVILLKVFTLHDLRHIDTRRTVKGVYVERHIVAQLGAVHIGGEASLYVGHAANVGDVVHVALAQAAQIHPVICQIAILKIGFDGQIQHPPRTIQTAVHPCAQRAQQHNSHKLHGAAGHIPPELSSQHVRPAAALPRRDPCRCCFYHAISSTLAGWGLTAFS